MSDLKIGSKALVGCGTYLFYLVSTLPLYQTFVLFPTVFPNLYTSFTLQNKNIEQFDLATKKLYRFENLSETLKTWSNDIPNFTNYKFLAGNKQGPDPILGGWVYAIEGQKADGMYEWQKATSYNQKDTKNILFRHKFDGVWSDWDRITTNSDLSSQEIIPTIQSENTNYTLNYIKAIKKANICFVTVEFVCNKSQPGDNYTPMATGLPVTEMSLYDSNGTEELPALLYVDSNGKLIIRNGKVGSIYRMTYSYPCK